MSLSLKTLLGITCALCLITGFGSQSNAESPFKNEVEERLDYLVETEDDVKRAKVKVEVEANENERHGIDFTEFDVNKDGVYEKSEVGEKLFTIFDRDGNEVIDNREMKKIGLKVHSKMKKRRIETVEYHSDGKEQKKTISEEDFIRESKLIKFDQDEDGLSPLDFLGMTFYRVDVNDDGVIGMYEWQRAYAESIRPLHEERFNYNQ